MGSESIIGEGQDLCADRGRSKRSNSQSCEAAATPDRAESDFHGGHRGSSSAEEYIDLCGGDPDYRHSELFCDGDAHEEPPSKRPKLCSDLIPVSDNTSTNNATKATNLLSDEELIYSKTDFENLQRAEARSRQDLDLERLAHADTKNKLDTTTEDLRVCDETLNEMKYRHSVRMTSDAKSLEAHTENHERKLRNLQEGFEQEKKRIELAKEEALRGLKTQIDVLRQEGIEALKCLKTQFETDLHIKNGDMKELKTQFEALRREKDEDQKALRNEIEGICQEKETLAAQLNITSRDLAATREKFASHRDDTSTRNAELEDELKILYEEQEMSKELHETRVLLNKKLETRVKSYDKKLSEAREKLKRSQAENESDISQLHSDIEELNIRKNRILEQKKMYKAALETQAVQHNEATNDLLEQLRDSQGLSQRYNFIVSDEEIIEKWGHLRHIIRQFVNKYTRPLGILASSLGRMWTVLSPIISELAARPLLYFFAFEAYVWEWLCLAIFNPGSTVWAGTLGSSFSALSWQVEDRLRGSNDELMAEYHSWRATSGNLLSRVSQREYDTLSPYHHVSYLVHELGALLGPNCVADGGYHHLVDIFNVAREFEVMRRKLKPNIQICFGDSDEAGTTHRYNMPMDNSSMSKCATTLDVVDPTETSGPSVKLIVSPAIVRWGNSSGVDYDRKKCLVKMDVVMSQSPSVVPNASAQPVSTTDHGQMEHHSNSTKAKGRSVALREDTNSQVAHKALSSSSVQPALCNQSTSAAMVPQTTSRPRRSAREKSEKHSLPNIKEETQ